MKTKSFLLEIGTEEIPAGYLQDASGQLKILLGDLLDHHHIGTSEIKVYYTPRRLTVFIEKLAEHQNDRIETVKGPPVRIAFDNNGTPTNVAESFAKKVGLAMEELKKEETAKGVYLFAKKSITGEKTQRILEQALPGIITRIRFPKSMRWGTHSISFARPIQWILCLYGSTLVSFNLDGLKTDRVTFGHRSLGKGALEIDTADLKKYFGILKKNGVYADQNERREHIESLIKNYVHEHNLDDTIDNHLLETVLNLVEFPALETGSFSKDYLTVPDDVLVTAMKSHQKYFPLFTRKKVLENRFIVIFNGEDTIRKNVRKGNERVLNARLADARFFWDEDKKIPLADRVDLLKTVVFQEKLGTYFDKTERVKELTEYVCDSLSIPDSVKKDALRAAYLSKTDLITEMVKEFPTLQGIMGREYALVNGETPEASQAIFEHYLPRFAKDILPESHAGAILAIADKIDTIAGCFSANLIPTGSQDPYMLRRHTLGLFRIIAERKLTISLSALVKKALQQFTIQEKAVLPKIMLFIKERMDNYLLNNGYDYDLVNAVLETNSDDFLNVLKRLDVLKEIRNKDFFLDSVTIVERTYNIMKNSEIPDGETDPGIFTEKDENVLFNIIKDHEGTLNKLCEEKDYISATKKYTALFKGPVHDFFENVMVLVDDVSIRNNRLSLLRRINSIYTNRIADLSKIVITDEEPQRKN